MVPREPKRVGIVRALWRTALPMAVRVLVVTTAAVVIVSKCALLTMVYLAPSIAFGLLFWLDDFPWAEQTGVLVAAGVAFVLQIAAHATWHDYGHEAYLRRFKPWWRSVIAEARRPLDE